MLRLIRNWKRSLIYLLLTVILFSLITIAFLIHTASNNAIHLVMEGTVPFIVIKADYIDNEACQPDDLLLDGSKEYLFVSNGYAPVEHEPVNNGKLYSQTNKLMSLCTILEQDNRISKVYYHLIKKLTKGNMRLWNVHSSPVEGDRLIPEVTEAFVSETADEFFRDSQNKELINLFFQKWHLHDTTPLYGENYPMLYEVLREKGHFESVIPETKESKLEVEGRLFTQQEIDNGAFVCIAPVHNPYDIYNISGRYNFNGDKLIYSDFYIKEGKVLFVKTYEFIIIGHFSFYKETELYNFNSLPIFVPNNTLLKIQNEQTELMQKYDCEVFTSEWMDDFDIYDKTDVMEGFNNISKAMYISSPRIEIKDVKYLEEISDYIKDYCNDIEGLLVVTSTEEYDKIAGHVKMMKELSLAVLSVSVLCSSLILILVTLLQTRDRKNEMGIYIALGENHKAVVYKMIKEYCLLTLIGVSIALIISTEIGSKVADYIIRSNTVKSVASEYLSITTQQVIKSFKIVLDAKSLLVICSICCGILLTVFIAIILYMNKTNPKDILQDSN